jgi:CDP-4-dehydro-6-deoxyglucose reductase, E3
VHGIHHLVVELDFALSYLPGQYANILCEDGIGRSFSMASVPRGNVIEFCIRRVDEGHFTSQILPTLKAGDSLELELPLGRFRLHVQDYRPLLLIATGTGIAPIKAILQSLLDDPDCPPVSLYWGMRDEAELFVGAEIQSWATRLYEFNYVPVLSRPAPGWAGCKGYVQDAVAADFLDLSEYAVYICGSPAMVREVKRVVADRGTPIEHIYAEGFTLQTQTDPIQLSE